MKPAHGLSSGPPKSRQSLRGPDAGTKGTVHRTRQVSVHDGEDSSNRSTTAPDLAPDAVPVGIRVRMLAPRTRQSSVNKDD